MNTSTLFLVGATHRSAPLAFRERISLNSEAEAHLALRLKRSALVQEFVILNTCNRVELYVVGDRHHAARVIKDVFCSERQIERSDFERFAMVREGQEAVEHLCRVSAGLESQILGETEIFGQVKRAYATGQDRQTVGPILNRLFQKAFQAAKHVRANTGITTGQVSVANVAVDLATEVFGKLDTVRLLVVGAGEMAEKSIRAFHSRGVREICVTNRNLEKAAALGGEFSARIAPFETRETLLAGADIVVCSTASPGTVLSTAAAAEALDSRNASRPMLFIDLAMPRDIEADVGNLESAFLYNLDDLALVAARNREQREAHAAAGRAALADRTEALWRQLQTQLLTLPAAPVEPVGSLPLLA